MPSLEANQTSFKKGWAGGPGRPKQQIEFVKLRDAIAQQKILARLPEMIDACIHGIITRRDTESMIKIVQMFVPQARFKIKEDNPMINAQINIYHEQLNKMSYEQLMEEGKKLIETNREKSE